MQTRHRILLALLAAGCSAQPSQPALWTGTEPPRSRTPLHGEIETLWHAGGAVADTLLQLPRSLQADTGLVIVLDDGGRRLLAFDPETGALRWAYGGRGGGPDELANPRDARFDELGRILVLDPGNDRVTVIGRDGRTVRHARLHGLEHAEQMVPLPGGRLAVVTFARSRPLVVLDSAGTVTARLDMPWQGFASLPAIARQGLIASEGARWVYAFAFGDGWFPFDGEASLGFTGHYIDHEPFPGVASRRTPDGMRTDLGRTVCSACSAALSGGVLYVQPEGAGELRLRQLDLFRWHTAEYLGTLRLPWRAAAVEVAGDRLYALVHRPAPQLVAARLVASP
jgi:hypothetical protein